MGFVFVAATISAPLPTAAQNAAAFQANRSEIGVAVYFCYSVLLINISIFLTLPSNALWRAERRTSASLCPYFLEML